MMTNSHQSIHPHTGGLTSMTHTPAGAVTYVRGRIASAMTSPTPASVEEIREAMIALTRVGVDTEPLAEDWYILCLYAAEAQLQVAKDLPRVG